MINPLNEEIINNLPVPIVIFQKVEQKYVILKFNNLFYELNSEFQFLKESKINSDPNNFFEGDQPLVQFAQSLTGSHSQLNKNLIIKIRKRTQNELNIFKSFNIFFFGIKESIFGILVFSLDISNNSKMVDLNLIKLTFFNDLPIGILILKENLIILVNISLASILGYSDISGIINRRIEEFIFPEDLNDFLYELDIIKNSPSYSKQGLIYRFIKKNSEIIWLSLSFHVYREQENLPPIIIFSAIDVTENRKTQLTLLQNHRKASIGELTAGIAHEINNPLFGIMNYSSLLKEWVDKGNTITKDSEEYEFLEGIIKEAERISKIISNLSEFSIKSEDKSFVPTDINEVISKAEKLLSYQIRHTKINIIKEIKENLPKFMLQQFRIENLFFQMLNNSIQALQNINDRERIIKLTISTNNTEDNNKLIIKIYDNGEGMSDDTMIRIFDPFFTTKRETKAVGLGLSTVFNIINDHNGKIEVDSQLGKWTEFTIILPVVDSLKI